MAKPRVFVSSTYFDLKNVRADLERFIKTQGYDPVLNERGHIPYGSEEKLEEYCYKEIHLTDILVSIIGGRYGSQSKIDNKSISNTELKTAIDLGKQVYIFIDKHVYSEYKTYELNKSKIDISYSSVDNIRIFQFIEEVHGLPLNNTICSFETSSDITEYLKLQWAGLFQRLLSENSKQQEINSLNEIKSSVNTLSQLVTYLVEDRKNGNEALAEILKPEHPLFSAIKKELNIPYRVFFYNKAELSELLAVRSFKVVNKDAWDSAKHAEWLNSKTSPNQLLKVDASLFDEDDKLKPMSPEQWNNKNVFIIDHQDPSDDD
ncbi:DUF4062 domain-containing protein [Pseudomonas putida]|uniref:DUF4062 domain-containing protein n=1 Tax=Pseudomonas putida TaxID=303 RepID=A0A2S3WQR7_PSEPU|nr:DUF4062 domain-containing protein [Pseudomonas putida]POG03665.1 hypothetical protein BGP82_20595 [Pseudomonas putida]QRI87782.1 DUF4062 domain-containing protein [Pseudomonas putida]HDS0928796.1 DUF4062 domain-containing protein [Pseudomonas putida]